MQDHEVGLSQKCSTSGRRRKPRPQTAVLAEPGLGLDACALSQCVFLRPFCGPSEGGSEVQGVLKVQRETDQGKAVSGVGLLGPQKGGPLAIAPGPQCSFGIKDISLLKEMPS